MNLISRTTAITFLMTVIAVSSFAQTTEFSYQGSLQSSSAPANGNFDFEFALFDSVAGGVQLGSTLTRSSVAVANGIFAVNLDFGGQFPGGNRFLEIRIRPTGGEAYTTLSPRQPISSSPYSVQSLNATNAATATTATNATQLGGVVASQFVQTGDPRLIDPRPPTAGSVNYIHNGTAVQAASNFSISGAGTAGVLNARTQFQFNGQRILGIPGFTGNQNLAVGFSTGVGLSNGDNNSLFGFRAGMNLINGSENSFFGVSAGAANQIGNNNSFFGKGSGILNNGGDNNTFVGYHAGQANTEGDSNSFFGMYAGQSNVTGNWNSFFGHYAGRFTTSSQNTFIGQNAGITNETGGQNTALGFGTNFGLNSLNYATVIGAGATVSSSNTIQLGRDGVDSVRIGLYPGGGSTPVCTLSNYLTFCASSRRYKENILPFGGGLEILNRLQPVTFDWKESKQFDLGLIAEDVAEIEPLLVLRNGKGEIESVKYDQLTTVVINAVKEQQAQIEAQQKMILDLEKQNGLLQQQIELLTKLVCSGKAAPKSCENFGVQN